MTQNDEQLDAFEQLLESEFSDEDLQMLEDSIEEEIKQDALLKEEMEGEIFVVLNEFAEQAERYMKQIYDKAKITREINSEGKRYSNFLSYVSDALLDQADPYNLIFSVPRPMVFEGERALNSHSAYFKDYIPMTTIGGENMLLWDLRVNASNNALMIRFLVEPNVYAPTVLVQLDLTDRNITNHFLDPLPSEPTNNLINVQRAVLEFLIRFFTDQNPDDDHSLDSEDFQELILQKIDTDSNDLVNTIVSINQIIDKYAEKKRREEFKKTYAKRGIEAW